MYSTVEELLYKAKVAYVTWSADTNILLTGGNQLVGRYSSFKRFRKSNTAYRGSEAKIQKELMSIVDATLKLAGV